MEEHGGAVSLRSSVGRRRWSVGAMAQDYGATGGEKDGTDAMRWLGDVDAGAGATLGQTAQQYMRVPQ